MPSRPSFHLRRLTLLGVMLMLAALTVTACGSSSKASSATTSAAATGASRAAFVTCMKSHGVTVPAHPGADGGSQSGAGQGHHHRSPAFRSARRACRQDLPGGGRGAGRHAGHAHYSAATLRTFSTCVKSHGYTLPTPNTSGTGPIFPKSIRSNASFRKAASACRSDLKASSAG